MYTEKVEDGIRILRNNGIEPRLWETPHYAGSPLAYRTFSHYFSYAIENRDPVEWMPYPAGPDRYGQMLIPENIGYINPAKGKTVGDQLRRANTLRIVRDSWAVGFYHPASIPLSQLKSLVRGLQRQGYTFADLRSLPMKIHYGYRPNLLSRFNTWRLVDLRLALDDVNYRLESQYAWWPTVRGVPWLSVLLVGSTMLFFVRLRKQWRPATEAPRSVVASAGTLKSDSSSRLATRRVLGLLASLVLVGGLSLFGLEYTSSGGEPDRDSLRGWSSLNWTVAYDGYGKVKVKNGSASLKPLAPQRPVESHAALATSGGTDWHDYTFRVRMNLKQQLRQNSKPRSWEAGWIFFRYQGEDRSYYLVHKVNGLELGKLVPPEGEGQIFLVTKPQPSAVPGRWYDYRIECRGANIKVYVNDKLQINYTDPDPISPGGVGLYTEDAHVLYRQPTVTKIPSGG